MKIEDLKPGQIVILWFSGDGYVKKAKFLKSVSHDYVEFESIQDDRSYTWPAYIFNGRWCYGANAAPLWIIETQQAE